MNEKKKPQRDAKGRYLKGSVGNHNGGFKKGVSGNPAGRPKKSLCIPDMLRDIGCEPSGYKDDDKIKALLRMVYKQAIGGNMTAVQFIADRTEGRAVQTNVELIKRFKTVDEMTDEELDVLLGN